MEINVDLHSHSMFSGGAGGLSVSKDKIQENMKKAINRFQEANKNSLLKGLHILGTGDIQFEPWLNFIKQNLEVQDNGLLTFDNDQNLSFILQSEIILTASIEKNKRKSVHCVVLFPSLDSVKEFQVLLRNTESKIDKLPRPFVKLEDSNDVSKFLFQINEIDKYIEIIPAHILTPEGVYGGNNGVNRLEEFFGDFYNKINIVETGLSADPTILNLIPELDNKTLISNSDAHSAQLHRIGREFTILDIENISYNQIISSLRDDRIIATFEFPVTEGRYFFTGHRKNRKKPGLGHNQSQYCYFSPDKAPKDNICPICKGQLSKGVLQRALEISTFQGGPREIHSKTTKKIIHGLPLTEVISYSLNIKSPIAKSVIKKFHEILSISGNEINFWKLDINKFISEYQDILNNQLFNNLKHIFSNNFSFDPPGFDGEYGKLVIGKKVNYFNHSVVNK